MRIEQLEYIAAVTQHGSLRRASEHLHISQPALSEAVTKLERELGVSLLDRRRSGARISRRGRELQQYMVEVLEAVDRLRTAAGDQQAGHHVVRIGTVSTATSTLLVPAVREFRSVHPGGTVEVLNTQQADIDQGLREGTIDLGLVNVLAGDDQPTDLVSTILVHGRPIAVLPQRPPADERDAGDDRPAACRAVRRDAGRLPDAPVRAPALRRRDAVGVLHDRRCRARQGDGRRGPGLHRAARLQRGRRPDGEGRADHPPADRRRQHRRQPGPAPAPPAARAARRSATWRAALVTRARAHRHGSAGTD